MSIESGAGNVRNVPHRHGRCWRNACINNWSSPLVRQSVAATAAGPACPALQAASVPSAENLDFVMESLALGHVVIGQKEVRCARWAAHAMRAVHPARLEAGAWAGGNSR